MLCKACKRTIEDDSIFCRFCGERQIKQKNKEVSVPRPTQNASGDWTAQIMVNGKRHRVTGSTQEEYRTKARALKLGLMQAEKEPDKRTLRQIIRAYIDSTSNTLSPSTIRGYETILRTRFQSFMDIPVGKIDFQRMVNSEARTSAPKTVVNAWALVSVSLSTAGMDVPRIKKPSVPASDEDWLDFEQIKLFLKEIYGQPVELAALLALHGLRRSELLDLDVSQITEEGIVIRGATVMDRDGNLVHKDTNKNKSSRRTVPIMIPRVLELLPESGKAVSIHPNTIYRAIGDACKRANLPICSAHDLRRSFASLAFHLGWDAQTTMQVGGWSDLQTVNAVYRKLASKDKNRDIKRMASFYSKAQIT